MVVERPFRWGFLLLFVCCLCLPAKGRASETIAILPFENNSLTDPERYAPLAKGFAAMLTTEMGRKAPALKMVERTRIDALLRELQLGTSGLADEVTAVRAGKILGARHIAFGSFMILEGEVRMDVRIIRVETSEVVAAESVSGRGGEILNLINRLSANIAASFKGSMAETAPATTPRGKLDAALYFSRGVEALDRGRGEEAKAWFEKCLQSDPIYRAQIESLKASP